FMRFEGPGRYAKDVDLESAAIKTIVGAMVSKRIYSDPTMVAFESLYVPENGDLSPSYAPFVGTMPPATERGFRTGGFAVPKGLTRADYRASWAKMVALLGKMHQAGVPIVAGTDGAGIEIVHELEIYVQAGFSPADALAAATIVPARLVGQDAKTGSLKPGKAADLALVDGDPSARIGDLRQTRGVMLDGKLLDADPLRTAGGRKGPPPGPPAHAPAEGEIGLGERGQLLPLQRGQIELAAERAALRVEDLQVAVAAALIAIGRGGGRVAQRGDEPLLLHALL